MLPLSVPLRASDGLPHQVRVGHPARLLPSVLGASLDARLAVSEGAAIVRDVKDDLSKARNQLRCLGKSARGALKAEV